MNKNKISAIFAILQKLNPKPTTELQYKSVFELLIAVILSAQATDISVNKATTKLFAVANTPEDILSLGEIKLKKYIKSIGLLNNKTKHILATCHKLIEEHDGCVPNKRIDLEKLPGVGRKTANVILNTAFGQPTIAVDTHIFRIANRIGLVKATNVLSTEKQLLVVVPEKYLKDAHHLLILHGRYTCTARKPKCYQCPIYNYCEYSHKIC